MAKSLETLFTNAEIGKAFSDASANKGIILPDGKGLKITPKSGKSTWSKNPNSFETDDAPKTSGAHADKWVLWTPSIDTFGRWNLLPEDDNSALVRIAGGALRPFARAVNSKVRGSTVTSKEFQAHRDVLKLKIARNIALEGLEFDLAGRDAEDLVVASLPEAYRSDENVALLSEQGAVFLGQVVDLGKNARDALLESAE